MAEALAVLLLAGSACHWNVCVAGVLVLLLNDEATKSSGREVKPLLACSYIPECRKIQFAADVDGRRCRLSVESRLLDDSSLSENSGIAFTVPPVVVTSEDASGVQARLEQSKIAARTMRRRSATVAVGGTASTKADRGSPPRVCASAAFNA